MKRLQWSTLFFAAVFALAVGAAPSSVQAQNVVGPQGTPFEAQVIPTLNINGNSSSGGLVELQNTGLAISNVAGCSYVPYGSSTAITGYAALVTMIMDGAQYGSQGIVGVNELNPASTHAYCITMDWMGNTQYGPTDASGLNWGGIKFSDSDAQTNNETYAANSAGFPGYSGPMGDMLIRETYVGDANLDGTVDIANDLAIWQTNFGLSGQANYVNPTQWGPAAGDFAYNDTVLGSGGIDVPNDLAAWQTNGTAVPPIGDGNASVASNNVAVVPEPGTFALLMVAALSAVVCLRSRLRPFCLNISKWITTCGSGGFAAMKRCASVLVLIGVLLSLAGTANAELLYILRPVTGDTIGGSGASEAPAGDYTITGNGITTAFGVTIKTLPPTGTTWDIDFQVYAMVVGHTAGEQWYQNGIISSSFGVQNTQVSGNLTLTPNISSLLIPTAAGAGSPSVPLLLQGEPIISGNTAAGGGNFGLLTGAKSLTTSIFLNSGNSGYDFPGTSSSTNYDLTAVGATAGTVPTSWANSGGTLTGAVTLIKLADLGFEYTSTLMAGTSTLQALTYTNTSVSATTYQTVAEWWDGATSFGQPPAGGNLNISSLSKSGILNSTGAAAISTNPSAVSGLNTTLNTTAVTVAYAPSSGSTTTWAAPYANLTSLTSGTGTLISSGTANALGLYGTTSGTATYGTIFGGQSTTITGAVTNTTYSPGTGTQDALNWSVSASSPLGGTLTGLATTGNSVAIGSAGTFSYTYSANVNNFFGPDSLTFSSTGLGTSGGSAALISAGSGSQTITMNIIGVANKGGIVDGSGVASSIFSAANYGNQLHSAAIGNGGSFAGMETSLAGSSSHGIGATYAEILAGSNLSGSPTQIGMAWRSRSASELPSTYHAPSTGYYPLYSDVVNLTGVLGTSNTATSAQAFTLQMSYDPNQVSDYSTAASGGFLFLGYRDSSGNWHNATAVTGSTQNGTTVVGGDDSYGTQVLTTSQGNGTWTGFGTTAGYEDYQGSWANFTALGGPGYNTAAGAAYSLSALLGSWGIDTTNNVVWAVIDHDGTDFAVVPEPGTLALLAAGAGALCLAYRRRKAAKI